MTEGISHLNTLDHLKNHEPAYEIDPDNGQHLLENWYIYGSLWLLEDPLFFEHHLAACADAARWADPHKPEHQLLLHDFLHAPEPYVRRSMTENQDLPAEYILLLLQDPEFATRLSIIKHPNTPPHRLATAAMHPDFEMRQQALAHRSVPAETLQYYLQEYSNTLSKGVCRERDIPDDLDILLVLLLHPTCQQDTLCLEYAREVLAKMAGHTEWAIRHRAAQILGQQEPCMDLSILEKLRQDPHRIVKVAAHRASRKNL